MKKYMTLFAVVVVGIWCSVSISHSEMAKEGNGNYVSAKSGTFEILKLGKNRLQMNWDVAGAFVEAPSNSPLENASYHSIGTLHAIDRKTKSNGGIVFTRPNGDQIFGTFISEGVLKGPLKSAVVEFTGGTGECEGIEGRMVASPRPKVTSSTKGGWQAIGLGKVTWKIP